MKKGYMKLSIICLTLILVFILNVVFNMLNIYTYILFLLFLFIGMIFLIGYEKDDYLFKKDILITVLISCLFYMVITYSIGLFLGFTSNGYKLTLINVLKNIIPMSFIILIEELIRYNLVKKGSRNKYILGLIVLVLTCMDIILIIKGFNLSSNYELVNFLVVYILPSLGKNIYLTYVCYKAGYKPNVLYRFIMELPIYFVPIAPALGMYMESTFKILLPAILIFIVYKVTNVNNKEGSISNPKIKKIGIITFIFFMLIMIGVNSGWFKYYSLTVGSGSMEPTINIGDVIIVNKLNSNEIDNLKIGDILVFKYLDKILVHRITEIEVRGGVRFFRTKGDANETVDAFITQESNVIGITKQRIPYIGYPVVWLNEQINKNR